MATVIRIDGVFVITVVYGETGNVRNDGRPIRRFTPLWETKPAKGEDPTKKIIHLLSFVE